MHTSEHHVIVAAESERLDGHLHNGKRKYLFEWVEVVTTPEAFHTVDGWVAARQTCVQPQP